MKIFSKNCYFAKCLETDIKGETVFNELKTFFDAKDILLVNILSVATDGASAMVGQHRGFLAYLKQAKPNILSVHCFIHRHHLVAKNLGERLHGSLDYVIQAVNKIKGNALNERLFAQLCLENDEVYNCLLLNTEVRWLSKGAYLDRFYALFDLVLEFLDSKDNDLRLNLINSKNDIAYMTDLFAKFNETNLKLQGDQLNLIETKSIISAFVAKRFLYKQIFGRRECSQFPNLPKLQKRDDDLLVYCQH
ncbi:protein FAM200C-like [Centruroides vittatus]|uniref:protein FAM200C-like n=1 Tax=Centruroides vittatus TaxID=120091 RepID=UPI0035102F66